MQVAAVPNSPERPATGPPIADSDPPADGSAEDVVPIDLMASAGPAGLKRLAPVVLLVGLIALVVAIRRRLQP